MNTAPKILIVDDQADIREIYTITFEAEGFQVMTAMDGLDGISKAVEFRPDVILLDLMMPQMDGFEVLTAMRQNSSMNVKIIVISNISQAADIERATKSGANGYLSKADNDPDQVVAEVKKHL
jgi:CheY-like chemotaxis protein